MRRSRDRSLSFRGCGLLAAAPAIFLISADAGIASRPAPAPFLPRVATQVARAAGLPPGLVALAQRQPVVRSLPKRIRLGRSEGFTADLGLAYTDDAGYNPFYLNLRVRGDFFFGLKRVRVEAGEESFELRLPPETRIDWGFGVDEPPSPNASLEIELQEDRTFPLPIENARLLVEAREARLILFGSSDSTSSFVLKAKAMERIREWLEPRVIAAESANGGDR